LDIPIDRECHSDPVVTHHRHTSPRSRSATATTHHFWFVAHSQAFGVCVIRCIFSIGSPFRVRESMVAYTGPHRNP
ncbi:MAG: hypothetical protein ACOYEV_09580, partial [Candidatus Nanopelagicales bacterium]